MGRSITRQFILLWIVQIIGISQSRTNSTSYTSSSSSSVSFSKLSVCTNSAIRVTNVTVLCDSPGTYYYGSGKYRSNPTCVPGDKAKLTVDFFILEDLSNNDNKNNNGGQGNALLTVEVQAGSGKDYSYTVYWNAYLCGIETLTLLNRTNYECPEIGMYRMATQFNWAESETGDVASFTPIVMVGFKSSRNEEKYDLGGANTDLCPEGKSETYVSWTRYVKPRAVAELNSFYWCVGILAGVIAVFGAFLFYVRRRQCQRWCSDGDEDPFVEVMEDDKKMQLFRSNKMLVDF